MNAKSDLVPSIIDWQSELNGAKMMINSGLVPKDVRTPEAALFIILTGRDMGLSPVQSLRGIKPIQGKIECSADLQLGLYHRSGGKSQWLEISDTVARLKLLAPWMIEPHVCTFTVEDARRAELLSNPTWRKYPKAMLRSRAITAGLKDIGFLLGNGVYAPGELGGSVVVDESTGEVLSGSQESAQPAREITSTAGTVESLDDEERIELENNATTISTFVQKDSMESALNEWHSLSTDQKVAVWAMLEKPVRKTLKAADKANRDSVIAAAISSAPAVSFATLIQHMKTRTEIDTLDADADLLQYLPVDQQAEAAAEYHRCRTALIEARLP